MLERFGLVPHQSKTVSVGQIFGRLTVLAIGKPEGTYRYTAICQCACGSAPKAIRLDGLVKGTVIGCGCVQRERSATHLLTKTPFLSRWRHMMDRCYNPDCEAFPDYGGRGIKVCERWHDIRAYAEDVAEGYSDGLHLDRIDNDGDYEPGNVRWATPSRNMDNRRSGRKLTFNGKTQSTRAWARETGLSAHTISGRISRFGWSVEEALTTPALSAAERMARARAATAQSRKPPRLARPPRQVKRFEHAGKSLTLSQWSDETGIPVKLLRKRICERGWPVAKALGVG